MTDRDEIRPTRETMSCSCDCNHNSTTPGHTPYSIERPASDRPLEAYAVGRIYQLEAQVEDQKNHIVQLKDTLDRFASDYHELMEILKPNIDLTSDGGIRKLNLGKVTQVYCKYERDAYYKLVAHFGLQKENYQACLQEYENEVLNGTETDLSDDERCVVKADYEHKLKEEGENKDAD